MAKYFIALIVMAQNTEAITQLLFCRNDPFFAIRVVQRGIGLKVDCVGGHNPVNLSDELKFYHLPIRTANQSPPCALRRRIDNSRN